MTAGMTPSDLRIARALAAQAYQTDGPLFGYASEGFALQTLRVSEDGTVAEFAVLDVAEARVIDRVVAAVHWDSVAAWREIVAAMRGTGE